MDTICKRVLQSLHLTEDFYKYISESHLNLKLNNLPSNTIGEQAYCIIGARESYLNALKKGEWSGFSCSLFKNEYYDHSIVINKLEETRKNIHNFLEGTCIDNVNLNLLIDLLEHEVQHHGQLIRYAYASKLGFPNSWNTRYTV
ncbi:hypothetical protein [Alkalihalobacterium elongatum]|uniref:hypothetical protein n=1 Tax=Alkalihalobacterium elongatum TaxID=2675466 RepID=UPI001C1FE5C9|nr:hypothetical protein [Alkalihalobacterium elongatum]